MGNNIRHANTCVQPIKTDKKYKIKTKRRRKRFQKTKGTENDGNNIVFTHWSELKQLHDGTNHSPPLDKVMTACREKYESYTENDMQTSNMTFEEDGFTQKEEENVYTMKEEKVTTNGLEEEQRTDRIVAEGDDKHEVSDSPNTLLINTSGNEDSKISKMLGTTVKSSKSENPHLPETEQRNGGNKNEIMEAKFLAEVTEGNVAPKSEEHRELKKGYMTVAEYADNAHYYTLSRLQTKDKSLYQNFKSLPNLSDIKNTNLEYHNHDMKEFRGGTEFNASLSDVNTFETEEHFQIMPEVKDGSGFWDDDPMNQMQELKIVPETQTTTRNMRYVKKNIPARLSGITVSSTDSGRSSNVTDLSATKLKQLQQGYTKYLCKPGCMKCRAALIEYMVEVYEPLIIRQIKVIDILDFLPLMDKRLTEMLRSKHRQSPLEAMELLLRLIRESDDPGKWQSFLDAIHKTEFIYIYMLLNAETEVQYDYSTAVLSLIKPEIKARMCLPEFLDQVFEKGLITEMEKDEAISFSSGIETQSFILDSVDKHMPNWDNVFVEVLNESCMNDLADLFLLVSQKEAIFTESNATTKGKKKRKSVRRAIRNQRLRFIEKAHGRPGFTSQMKPALYQEQTRTADNNDKTLSASKVQGIDRTERYENKSPMDFANIDEERKCYVCDKSFDERNKNRDTVLQNILSEVTEFKYQQEALCNRVKDLTHGMNELRLCLNKLLLPDAKKETISVVL